MQVIATAGHVDHGKSTLVRALTGMEPDRWAEERRRGMTIDLGFAWRTLPSGERVAFVDVPGHERFVTNMLAGLGPVPAVMIVVAADEGWKPQSAEHLAAIDALGFQHGLLVVTRADLADPSLALRQARTHIERSSLRNVESVAVSGTTGEGLDVLVAALDRLAARLPPADPQAPVRLWIDPAFTVAGSGTVVTGTLPAGTVSVGDELLLGTRPVRIRRLEALREGRDVVSGVARIAVNLRGVDRSDVTRGMALVTPGRWTLTGSIDVRLNFAEASGRLPRELVLHVGSAAVPVRLRPLGADTARLLLNAALPLHVGDRGLLRDPGRRTVAGVSVLDVRPPVLTRRGAGAARARELASWPDRPGGEVLLRRHGLLRPAELEVMGAAAPPQAVRLGSTWIADPGHWEGLRERLAVELVRHAAAHPLAPGIPIEAARLRLGLPSRQLVAELVRPPLRLADGRVYGPSDEPGLPAPVAEAVGWLADQLRVAPFQAPDAEGLVAMGLVGPVLAAAVSTGAVLVLARGIVLLPGADREAVRLLAALPQPFTPGEARDALSTTRRVIVPLLEHLDRLGYTERLGDRRRLR